MSAFDWEATFVAISFHVRAETGPVVVSRNPQELKMRLSGFDMKLGASCAWC